MGFDSGIFVSVGEISIAFAGVKLSPFMCKIHKQLKPTKLGFQ